MSATLRSDTPNHMTTDEFRAWLDRHGLNDERAGPLLASHPSEVTRWRNGVRKVPRKVAMIVALRDALDAVLDNPANGS